jgi:hypothetical protein
MISVPMLADFAIRLAFGLASALLMTSRRAVPLGFFRAPSYALLGLLVLASLDQGRSGGQTIGLWCLLATAVLAYLATLAWGLGVPAVARGATGLIALATAAWLAAASLYPSAGLWIVSATSRLASGCVLGSALCAMLLGHYHLTAPTMSIEPLKRNVAALAVGLGVRGLLAVLGMWLSAAASQAAGTSVFAADLGLTLAARWGFGFLGAGTATFLTWKTVEIRSTQSATGLLYITVVFLLLGELTSLILTRSAGVVC